jgi:DNA-directed RNA polymerase subunit RPC12/RpoP
MSIRFACPSCGAAVNAPDQAVGKIGKCPQCRVRVSVPHALSVPVPPLPSPLRVVLVEEPILDALPADPKPAERQMEVPLAHPVPREEPILDVLPAVPQPPSQEAQDPVSRPRNYAEDFVRWQRRFPGQNFPFICPKCDTHVQLRQRVVQSRRVCPGCGFRITTEAIDSQLEAMARPAANLEELILGLIQDRRRSL